MTSFTIRNFGCRVNQAEAFEWAAVLQERGWLLTDVPADDGLIIVNTCTLTARADRDVRKYIRKTGREHPGARILITGCLAERSPGEWAGLPGVWKVLANRDKARLPDVLETVGRESTGRPAAAPRFRARAFLKVQDGCDMSCAFCIIPSVRGRGRSLPWEKAVGRARELARGGYAEIVLTGIHLSSYGRDLVPRSSLCELLQALDAAPEEFHLRLSSLDPRLMPGPLLDLAAHSRKIRPHFHLSLQHASGPLLRAMGRASTPEEYRELLQSLDRRVPDAALGADIIVGFPGETEEDFAALAGFIEQTPLTYVHVFAYSPRPGTAAEGRGGVGGETASRRAKHLRELSRQKDLSFRRRFSGRELDGIVIGPGKNGLRILTANAIDVSVPGRRAAKGRSARVRIVDAIEGSTRGELIE
jgi:threonylcarbamoyladenosine tRNA methylthiotransferase MtaB